VKPLGDLIPKAMERDVVQAARATEVLRRWEEVVGADLATRSWPDRFDKGTVWVAVTGSAWAQELRLRKEQILRRLNELSTLGKPFTDVRFGVRKLPTRPVEEKTAAPEPESELDAIRERARQRLAQWDVDQPD
jgi:predicted nucleic acid-binding Zn ribbon protein